MSIKRSNKIQWKQYPIAWFYLLGGIAILLIVGVVSKLKTNEEDIETKEKEWYVQQLNYNFCAAVTSVEPLKQKWGYGYIICDLDSTVAVDITKEDSLQQFLKTNKHIRFIVSTSRGKVKLLVPGVFEWRKNDTICIDAWNKKINVTRSGKHLNSSDIIYYLKTEEFD